MRSPIDNETLGIRLHEVNKQRAVDRAIERMRHGLHADWFYLSAEDHASLRWVIGELWATTSREHWEQFHFSKLDYEQARRLVMVGDRLRGLHTRGMSSLETAADLVRQASASPETGTARSFA